MQIRSITQISHLLQNMGIPLLSIQMVSYHSVCVLYGDFASYKMTDQNKQNKNKLKLG